MRDYAVNRLILLIPTFFITTFIIFVLVRVMPGDVLDRLLQDGLIANQEQLEVMRTEMGINRPLVNQYVEFIGDIFRGDFGKSLWTDRKVINRIGTALPVTLEITFLGMLVAVIVAIPVGVFAALRQDSILDYLFRSSAFIWVAAPTFWVGTIVITFPAIWWGYLAPIRYARLTEDPVTNLQQFIVPALILGLGLSGSLVRITRAMMLEVLRQDYIRTARAKGLVERVVIYQHALKNAMIPVVTGIGLSLPLLVGGSVILENIFNLPGLGRLAITALEERDYPVISAVNLFFATAVLVFNLLIDLIYPYLDPRVRHR
jgi:peptide/nickel transport system permease protein